MSSFVWFDAGNYSIISELTTLYLSVEVKYNHISACGRAPPGPAVDYLPFELATHLKKRFAAVD